MMEKSEGLDKAENKMAMERGEEADFVSRNRRTKPSKPARYQIS